MDKALARILLIGTTLLAAPIHAQTAEDLCRANWTREGSLNKRMYEHCLEEQEQSARRLKDLKDQYATQSWFNEWVVKGCDERWSQTGRPPEMVAFCLTQEVESFKELKYQSGLKTYNSACAEACFQVWKSKPGTVFTKTWECYRKRAERPNQQLPKSLFLILESAAGGVATSTADRARQPAADGT